jgi:hypothetical protein
MDKIKTISNWNELLEFVESVNPYAQTIVLTGFINEWKEDNSIHVKQLIFETRPVKDIIKIQSNTDFSCFKPIEKVE